MPNYCFHIFSLKTLPASSLCAAAKKHKLYSCHVYFFKKHYLCNVIEYPYHKTLPASSFFLEIFLKKIYIFIKLVIQGGNMYNGNNKTALNSQKRIVEAMLEMIENESYDNITIKDICKRANISRQRFYYLFESKDEIVMYYLNDFFIQLEIFINDNNIISLYDLIFHYFSAIDKNEYIKKFMHINNILPMFSDILLKFMGKIHILKTNRIMDKNDFYANKFLSSGLNSIFIFWLEKNKEITLQELVAVIENILRGKMFE